MNGKETIRILPTNGRLLYNLCDAVKVLYYSNLEAALRIIPDESVVIIAYGDPNAEKAYYTDVRGLYALFKESKRPSLVKIKEQDYDLSIPDSLKDNQAVDGILYYPAELVLNIQETEHSDMDNSASEPCEYLFTISEIAEEYGMTGRKLNLYLELKGIQHRKGSRWYVRSKYKKRGYIGFKESNSHIYWTLDGKFFIDSLLKADGYERKVDLYEHDETSGL